MSGSPTDRSWQPGYAANCNPAPSIWDAWDWVARWGARFLGYWENGAYRKVLSPAAAAADPAAAAPMVMASCW